jgi:hypothetical protein
MLDNVKKSLPSPLNAFLLKDLNLEGILAFNDLGP